MRSFHELTARGRALRLRRLALAALDRYDLDVARVRLVTNDLNGIFRVDDHRGRKYIMRVSVSGDIGHPLSTIRSELMWLRALARDTNLVVPHPQVTRDGSLVTTIQADGVPEPRHCALFSWVSGPDLADRLTVLNVEEQGWLCAALHEHAGAFRPPDDFCVRRKDRVFPYSEPVVLFDPAYCEFMPADRSAVFHLAEERVRDALANLYGPGQEPIVIHNDLHQWNVKTYRGEISALDFEDLMWGFPVQDIAVSLYYYQGYDNFAELRDAFRHGYTKIRPWPEQHRGEIDAFIAGRGLTLANTILVDPNPEWRQVAPEFLERVERRLVTFLKD